MVISYISVQKKERNCLSINASLYHQQEPFIPLSFITLNHFLRPVVLPVLYEFTIWHPKKNKPRLLPYHGETFIMTISSLFSGLFSVNYNFSAKRTSGDSFLYRKKKI